MPSIVDFVNKHQRKLTVLAGAGLVAIGAAYYLGMGVVIDETTGKPIEGVFVVGRWRARQITPIESSSVCFKVDSTQSDANGRFMLWPVSWNFDPRLWSRERELLFYKRGYRVSDTAAGKESNVLMKPDDTSFETRLNYVSRMGMHSVCGTLVQRIRHLLPIYRAMIAEAIDISERSKESGHLDDLNWLAETLTLGSATATDNLLNKQRRIFVK